MVAQVLELPRCQGAAWEARALVFIATPQAREQPGAMMEAFDRPLGGKAFELTRRRRHSLASQSLAAHRSAFPWPWLRRSIRP
jgi:hypothetical protein